jgi:uncharacterized membrane protein HdeD (DUF308 family)
LEGKFSAARGENVDAASSQTRRRKDGYNVSLISSVNGGFMGTLGSSEIVRQSSGWSIVWGVLLVIFGMLAIAAPFLAAIAITAVVAWLIILAGIIHLTLGFQVHGAGSVIWKVLIGLAYICFGGYLIWHPLLRVAALTLVLASLFLIEGILDIILYFKLRSVRGSVWELFNGVITLLLGILIYFHWPSSSLWALGTLVGVSMIVSGLTRVMLSLGARQLQSGVAADATAK